MKSFGLGTMTLRSVFKRPETHQYPAEPTPVIAGRRGSVAITLEECIFCGACVRACPADAITVDRKESTWSINHLSCVQCASCTETCPQECLYMETDLPHVAA